DRHQRAKRQAALDHQIAADRKEEERRQLTDEVVEEFGEKLTPKDFEPDVVDGAQDVSEIGRLQLDRVVGTDFSDAGSRLLDPVGDLADGADAAFAELVNLHLQLGNDIALQRVERDRRDPEDRVLHKHEKDDRQQLPALEHRLHKGVADKAAKRFA